jgi:hypothetical protein
MKDLKKAFFSAMLEEEPIDPVKNFPKPLL